jgi:hypothetical protein
MTRALLTVLLALAGAFAGEVRAQPVPADPFAPMNLLLTEQRLAQVKSQLAIGDPLLVRARDQLVAEADAVVGRPPHPIVGVLEVPGFYTKHQARQQAITRQLRGDASAAHALAMAFAITGDARYADQAEAYLGAWVASLTTPKDGGAWWQVVIDEHRGDTRLVITYAFPHLLYAHDVLRGLGRIDAAEHARFVAWLRPFVDYARAEVLFKNNHHDWQCLFLAAAAHVTQDRALFDLAIRRFRAAFAVKLCPDGALGRELVRGEKAATYTLMALEAMLQTVAIGERHGYAGLRDLTSTIAVAVPGHGPRATPSSRRAPGATLRQAVDHLTDFVLDPQSWQRAHRLLPSTVNGPSQQMEWGWFFEMAHALWKDPRHLALCDDAPYGVTPARAYTSAYTTICFRPLLNGLPPTLAGEGAPRSVGLAGAVR